MRDKYKYMENKFKYNRSRIIQCCTENDKDGFLFYRNIIGLDLNIGECIIYSLRHGHVELSEYIISLYPELLSSKNFNKLFSYKFFNNTSSKILINIIKILDRKKTPHLYKIRDFLIEGSLDKLWRRRYVNELITYLNILSHKERMIIIHKFLKQGVNSENGEQMKDALKLFLRDETIDRILDM